MTLQEKYVGKILQGLGAKGKRMKGKTAYTFPCPLCTPSKKYEEKYSTAILMPSKYCEGEYFFSCCRGKCMNGKGLSLIEFLWRHKPYLAEKYKAEKKRYSANPDLPYNFKPNFNA